MNIFQPFRLACAAGCLAAMIVNAPVAVRAQSAQDGRGALADRATLEALVERLRQAAESPGYSARLRDEARLDAASVERRLREGDLQVGDRILLVVENEPALSDTFTVDQGRVLILPELGRMPLAGVLRAELESGLEAFIGRFLRDPVVSARSLVRVTVLGAVQNPGFLTVPSELLVTDVLMAAGGPAPTARMDDALIRRGPETMWDGRRLRQAIAEGRTLDQLGVRAGDQIFLPGGRPAGATESTLRVVSTLIALPLSIVALTQIF